jgi:VIT1/CCC1 family predicted Fe2+/Mn2+ transporter
LRCGQLEKRELKADPKGELRELQQIYRKRGLDPDLAMKVAEQLSRRDRLGAHPRDELGIVESSLARPLQAALVSAASFASSRVAMAITALIGHLLGIATGRPSSGDALGPA